jgi:hypothetical protein
MARPSPDPGSHAAGGGYERRRPEEIALYDVVRSEVETFLARDRDRPLPRFVERDCAPIWPTLPLLAVKS